MIVPVNINEELRKIRSKLRTNEEKLIRETKRILNNDLLAEKKILQNLGRYSSSFFVLDEEYAEQDRIYTTAEIKQAATNYRLKFLESRYYKSEIPYAAIQQIKALNHEHRKELKEFKILALGSDFRKEVARHEALLFAETNHGNYYLVHRWGPALPWFRRIKYWPLRSFENLALTVIGYTLFLALILPTWAITLDEKATYWSGYRGGVFFHLLIFNSGFTALICFSFFRNFSSSLWNKRNDFE